MVKEEMDLFYKTVCRPTHERTDRKIGELNRSINELKNSLNEVKIHLFNGLTDKVNEIYEMSKERRRRITALFCTIAGGVGLAFILELLRYFWELF